jgi:hypothetical protein
MDVVSGGRVGGRLVMAVFDATTRLVDDAPSAACRHTASNGSFCFQTLVCCQILTNCMDSSMAGSSGSSLSIRHGVCGGLISLELKLRTESPRSALMIKFSCDLREHDVTSCVVP